MRFVRSLILLGLFATAAGSPFHASAAAPAKPIISYVFFDGAEYRSEGDEYAVIKNAGGTALNLKGFRLNAGDPGQDFRFPSYTLNPGATVKVYTNRAIKGSFSYGWRKAIWNNGGDCGFLFNAAGKQVSQYCY
jgi:hypothetical protein